MGSVRVAIIGVGNCASSLVQGVQYYREAPEDAFIPGLMHPRLAGYHVGDIEFSAAFDIDARQGRPGPRRGHLPGPQQHREASPRCPRSGVTVQRGMTHDGLGHYLSQMITEGARLDRRHRRHPPRDRAPTWSSTSCPSAARWPPSGTSSRCSRPAARFVNCIPVFIAREAYWRRRFEERGLPVVGDDVKSQVGATIVHRVLTRLFMDRGVRLDRTSQLNFGGNTDFYNMLERERLVSKKISKTDAVRSQLGHDLPADRRAHRPQRLRAVARGPQVGAHPPGGQGLRRSADQRRAQARGVGLAELGRRRHRRHPLLQDRAGPRPQGRPAWRPRPT